MLNVKHLIGYKAMEKFTHNKTGNVYKVISFNITNKSNNDQKMVLYVKDNKKETNVLNQKKYVRNIKDFSEKFTQIF